MIKVKKNSAPDAGFTVKNGQKTTSPEVVLPTDEPVTFRWERLERLGDAVFSKKTTR